MISKNLIIGFLVFLCIWSNSLFLQIAFERPDLLIVLMITSATATAITLIPAWMIHKFEKKEGMAYCGMTFIDKTVRRK